MMKKERCISIVVDLPKSVGIIMDGNGRWAQREKLPRSMGHRKGVKVLKNIVRHANDIGIKYLIVYAFSTENWKRSQKEIDDLMLLLTEYLDRFEQDFKKSNIQIKIIGRRTKLATVIQKKIDKVENNTKDNDGLTFIVALDYGGRQEMVMATKKIADDVISGVLSVDEINEKVISDNVYTKDIPDPDMIIRTSGEKRISNFLMWQSVYSELFFLDVLWPDFTEKDFDDAIAEFSNRNRRFGGY